MSDLETQQESVADSAPALRRQVRSIEVSVNCAPALMPAMFDLLRTQAVMSGFPDVIETHPLATFTFGGDYHTTEHNVVALRERLEMLWLGAHVTVETWGKVLESQAPEE